MKIYVICVGKLKEEYQTNLVGRYVKEISKNNTIEIIELPDEKTPDNASPKEEALIREVEGERILNRIVQGSKVIPLCIEGKEISSVEFKKVWNRWIKEENQSIAFIIGGSLGLSPKVVAKGQFKLSFGKMTFPHQLMRVMLLEQLSLL